MCLIAKRETPLVAKTNLIVYKVLDENGRAPYWSEYQYYRGKVNRDEKNEEILKEEDESRYCVFGGFLHAYTFKEKAEELAYNFNKRYFRYDRDWLEERKFLAVEMIVPAGTEYYLSFDGLQICSKALSWEYESENNEHKSKPVKKKISLFEKIFKR